MSEENVFDDVPKEKVFDEPPASVRPGIPADVKIAVIDYTNDSGDDSDDDDDDKEPEPWYSVELSSNEADICIELSGERVNDQIARLKDKLEEHIAYMQRKEEDIRLEAKECANQIRMSEQILANWDEVVRTRTKEE